MSLGHAFSAAKKITTLGLAQGGNSSSTGTPENPYIPPCCPLYTSLLFLVISLSVFSASLHILLHLPTFISFHLASSKPFLPSSRALILPCCQVSTYNFCLKLPHPSPPHADFVVLQTQKPAKHPVCPIWTSWMTYLLLCDVGVNFGFFFTLKSAHFGRK
ncbi:hypothetical protein IW262DRAFT_1402910 [Armillaria fumosa]|nr:hypothetical protein IW262DRAFT_1402910 [Armillaria fumosa]